MELLVYDKETSSVKSVIDPASIEQYVTRKDTFMWLDIQKPTYKDMDFLERYFNIHPLTIEDVMTTIQRPKIDKYIGFLFIVLHAASLAPHKDKTTSLELDIFLSEKFIITCHLKHIKSLDTVRERIMKNPAIMTEGHANLFYNIADALVDNYFPILEKLDTDINHTEELILKDHSIQNVTTIMNMKEIVLMLRRFIAPQREIINSVVRGDYAPIISSELSVYFRDISDILVRIYDSLESYGEVLTSLLQAYTFVASNRLNDIMKVLTIISTIMMPLTLISSIYGMNFKHMPEIEWKYGYFFAIFIMISIGCGMLAFFKYKKWI